MIIYTHTNSSLFFPSFQSQRGPVERGPVREAADWAHARRVRGPGGHRDRLRLDVAQSAPVDAVPDEGRPRADQRRDRRQAAGQVCQAGRGPGRVHRGHPDGDDRAAAPGRQAGRVEWGEDFLWGGLKWSWLTWLAHCCRLNHHRTQYSRRTRPPKWYASWPAQRFPDVPSWNSMMSSKAESPSPAHPTESLTCWKSTKESSHRELKRRWKLSPNLKITHNRRTYTYRLSNNK